MRGVSAGDDLELGATTGSAQAGLSGSPSAQPAEIRGNSRTRPFDIGARRTDTFSSDSARTSASVRRSRATEIQLALSGLLACFRQIELAADEIVWHEIAVFPRSQGTSTLVHEWVIDAGGAP